MEKISVIEVPLQKFSVQVENFDRNSKRNSTQTNFPRRNSLRLNLLRKFRDSRKSGFRIDQRAATGRSHPRAFHVGTFGK